MTGLAAPVRRLRRLLQEMGAFAVVGAVALAVDVTLFNVAVYGMDLSAFAAKTGSTAVATTVAFTGNRLWTWRHRAKGQVSRRYLLYFVFSGVSLVIPLGCIAINNLLAESWPQIFDNPISVNVAANVIGLGLGAAFRFHAYRTWVFADQSM